MGGQLNATDFIEYVDGLREPKAEWVIKLLVKHYCMLNVSSMGEAP